MSRSPEKAETLPWVKITDISPTHDRDHRFNIARNIPTHGWSPDLLLAYRNTTHKHSFFFFNSRVFSFLFLLACLTKHNTQPFFPFHCSSFFPSFFYLEISTRVL